jgi:hypothetical protein
LQSISLPERIIIISGAKNLEPEAGRSEFPKPCSSAPPPPHTTETGRTSAEIQANINIIKNLTFLHISESVNMKAYFRSIFGLFEGILTPKSAKIHRFIEANSSKFAARSPAPPLCYT